MRVREVIDRFWDAKPCRLGLRDRVVVEGSAVSYLLWGREIARWDRDANVLKVDDCGWRTWLTKDRLNNIICDMDLYIYSHRCRWTIYSRKSNMNYYWKGSHKIYIKDGRIEPAEPVVKRSEISEKLEAHYEKAIENLETRRRMLVARLLDGTAYIFVDRYYSHFTTKVLIVKTHSPELEAWAGRLHRSTILSAFRQADPLRILAKVAKTGEFHTVSNVKDIISELEYMGFKFHELPEDLASSLAIANLIEA